MPSAKGFGKALEGQVGGEVKKSGSKMGGLLGGALKGGALAVVGAAGGVLGAALFSGFKRLNAIDQAQAKLAGLGHTTADVKSIMDNALSSVKGTAFGLGDAATVAASTVAAGVKPGKDLTATLKLTADAATIAGTSMGDMGAIFNKVATSNKVQGDIINQLNDKGIPIVQLLGKSMHKTSDEVMAMSSAGTIGFKDFSKAMQEGVGGAALKSGQTFTGAFANLKASLGRIGANLLQPLFSPVKAGMLKLTAFMSDSIEPVAKKVVPAISAVAGKVADAFGGSGGVGGAVRKVLPALAEFGRFFTGSVLPAVTSVGQYLIGKLGPIFTSIGNIISTRVVPIVASLAQFFVGELLPVIFSVYSSVAQKLKPVFDALVAAFQQNVLPTIDELLVKFREWQPTIQQVVLIVARVAGVILGLAATILGAVLPVVIRFAGFLISTLVPVIASIIGILIGVVGGLIGFGQAVYNAGTVVVNFFTTTIPNAFAAMKQGISTAFSAVVGFLKTWGPVALAVLVPFIGIPLLIFQHFSQIKGFMGRAWSAAYNTVTGWIGNIVRAVGSIPGKIGSLAGAMLRAGQNLMGALWRGLGSAAGATGRFVGSIASKIWGGIKGFVNRGLDTIRNFSVGAFGMHVQPFQWIPRLAHGGLTNGPMAAMVGDNPSGRELVAPLDSPETVRLLSKAMGQAGATVQTRLVIEGNVYGDDALIDRVNRLMDARDKELTARVRVAR